MFNDVGAAQYSFDALHRRHGRGLRAQGRDVSHSTDVTRAPESARAVRPHRDRDRRGLSLRPRPDRDDAARSRRRTLARRVASAVDAEAARLVLLPGAARHRASVSGAGQARPDVSMVIGDAVEGGQEQGGDRQRVRGGVAGSMMPAVIRGATARRRRVPDNRISPADRAMDSGLASHERVEDARKRAYGLAPRNDSRTAPAHRALRSITANPSGTFKIADRMRRYFSPARHGPILPGFVFDVFSSVFL